MCKPGSVTGIASKPKPTSKPSAGAVNKLGL